MARLRRDYEVDYRRVAETIFNNDVEDEIQDVERFNEAYNDYFSDEEHLQDDSKFRAGVYREYRKYNPIRGSIFRRAEGKSFDRDRQTTARDVVDTREEYYRRGARNVDLKGYDTKKKKFKRTTYGRIKGKTVQARKTSVMIRGKRVVRFRDKKGRFVGVR